MKEAKTIKNSLHFYQDTVHFLDGLINSLSESEDSSVVEYLGNRQRIICKDLRLHLGLTKKEVNYDDGLGY